LPGRDQLKSESMTEQQARKFILAIWEASEQRPRNPTDRDRLAFFEWLKASRADLLEFDGAPDKWPLVRSWLERHDSGSPLK